MPGIEFQEVARLLTCEQFAKREMQLRGKRAQCPFHGGENYNLAFMQSGRCHCYVCGKTADSLQLASAVWHLSQLDAARLLNDEFNLGLAGSTPTDAQREQRQHERERIERERLAEVAEYGAAADELREAERVLDGFTLADADNPAVWAAVTRLGTAQDRWHAMIGR